ncbi:TonB-dependent siderophore receptor [Brevundimonas sp. SL130]|uniref:TonB-dependent siderophore receptor n=1 Tax=Brevundimonas sp. SL130 TaxID=2995143 RepID=UPI00226CF603|nr:TonB-dependent siderophore receptor [Brevundimonas sp. SL130]WAC61465.1 TonB-dependent siderophore receptor [Brevundimonas sp. SL130]
MLRSALLASASISLLGLAAGPALAQTAASDEVSEVVVMGKRVIRESAGATGLDLSLRETPQSVTVIGAAQIKQFNLTDVNQLLATLPGVNVEAVETDRTYYTSRGFDIVNFQVDGVGQPLDWGLQAGALDVAQYERVEAVRGANGLMTGTGNPSATINYIRKRPTEDFQASASAGYGTWDETRLTADVSGPLNDSGTVRGRVVYANTDSDSYLNYYGVNRNLYYGILTWDVTPKLNATAGFSRQDNLATGVNWGALPLVYSDGTQINYESSETTGAPWTYWDTHHDIGFGELSYAFDNGWTIKGVYTHRESEEDAKLLYAYGNPDPATGLGVAAMSGEYPSDLEQNMFDVIANGDFGLFGRRHQVVLGFNTSTNDSKKWSAFADLFAYPAYQGAHIVAPAEPTYPEAYLAEEIEDRLTRAYGAVHLNLTDSLTAVLGFNAIEVKTTGYSYGVSQARDENKVSPYVGVVYDLNANISLYASYSDLFTPQSESDINRNRLDAAEGRSYEAGVKSEWLDGRLYATASIFKSEQDGLAEYVGYIPDTFDSYYVGVDTVAQGYEFEVAGRITPQWTVGGGFTDLSIEDGAGADTRLYIPRQSLKLNTTYTLPQYNNLTLGGAVRWQSDISTTDLGTTVTQDAYAVVDLLAAVDLTDHVRATVNAKNLFDEAYYGSLMWSQAFYAPPRSVMVTLDYRF